MNKTAMKAALIIMFGVGCGLAVFGFAGLQYGVAGTFEEQTRMDSLFRYCVGIGVFLVAIPLGIRLMDSVKT